MAKLLFIQNVYVENPACMLISAMVKKKGHTVDLLITNNKKDVIKKILLYKPDVIGISCISGNHKSLLALAKVAKEVLNSVKLLWGGPHPTYYKDFIFEDGVDIICIGEGEYPTLELLDSIDNKQVNYNIKNLHFKLKNGLVIKNDLRNLNDLDKLEFADRYLYKDYPTLIKSRNKYFFTGRGCPFSCNFCFTSVQRKIYEGKGKYYRKRSIDNIINEVKTVCKEFELEMACFVDDTFAADQNWTKEFLKKISELKLDIFVVMRFDEITPEIIDLLVLAGCKVLSASIETANETLRNKVINKRLSNEAITWGANELVKRGIKIQSANMFAFPGDTIENALKTVKMNIDLKIQMPLFFIYTPHPGTYLTELALQKGLIDLNYISELDICLTKMILKMNKNEKRQYVNLVKLAGLFCRLPFLFPLGSFLIGLPLGFVYSIIDMAYRFYVVILLRQYSLKATVKFGFSRIKLLFNF